MHIYFLLVLIFSMACSSMSAQEKIRKLVYDQEVFADGEKQVVGGQSDMVNQISHVLSTFGEVNQSVRLEFYYLSDTVFLLTYYHDGALSSVKYQVDGNGYMFVETTGERLEYDFKTANISKCFKDFSYKKAKKTKRTDSDEGISILNHDSPDYKITLHLTDEKDEDLCANLIGENCVEKRLIHFGELIDVKKNKKRTISLSDDSLIDFSKLPEVIQKIQGSRSSGDKVEIDLASIDIGDVVPDVSIQLVESDNNLSLHGYKGNGKLLIIDFWGTWCKPCIASIPHLKAFYEKHSDDVDVISLSYKDRSLSVLKDKIAELDMPWTQGIANESIRELLNPDNLFPGVLVIDDEMTLLYRSASKDILVQASELIKE